MVKNIKLLLRLPKKTNNVRLKIALGIPDFEDKGIDHVTNNCIKFKKVREELIDKLNKLDANTKNKTLLEIIEYYYYNKKLSDFKNEKRIIIKELN